MTTLASKVKLTQIPVAGFHKVIRAQDPTRGLDAIIAIHDIRLGIALGGTRIHQYPSFEAALNDALRLAEGMTYKSAVSQVGLGGGKSVILANPRTQKTEELLEAFGEAVHALEGEYICAEDVGSTTEDVAIIARKTPYVVGLKNEKSSGDPSYFTAWGVFRGIQAALNHRFGSPEVKGKTIAIQGLGSAGSKVAEFLFWHGAKLVVTDVHEATLSLWGQRLGAKIVGPEEIFDEPCDVFCPCALGGILHPETIERLRCKIVAGAANNQLLTEKDADLLKERDILYAPDFAINSGGLINVSEEVKATGYHPFNARNAVDEIYKLLTLVFDMAKKGQISTQKAIMQLVEYRLEHGIGKRQEPVYMHHAGISL